MNRNKEIEQTTDAILLMNGKAHARRTVCDPGNISNSVKEITTASKTVKNTLDGRLPSLPERTWIPLAVHFHLRFPAECHVLNVLCHRGG